MKQAMLFATPELDLPSSSNMALSNMVSSMFVTSLQTDVLTANLCVQTTTIVILLEKSPTASTESDVISLTQISPVKNFWDLTADDRVRFSNAKQEEISFILCRLVAVVSEDFI